MLLIFKIIHVIIHIIFINIIYHFYNYYSPYYSYHFHEIKLGKEMSRAFVPNGEMKSRMISSEYE